MIIHSLIVIGLVTMCSIGQAQESQRRFKILQADEMTQAQKDLVKSIASGPRIADAIANGRRPASMLIAHRSLVTASRR